MESQKGNTSYLLRLLLWPVSLRDVLFYLFIIDSLQTQRLFDFPGKLREKFSTAQPKPHRNMRIKTLSVVYVTFSINCVLESMRKSLKTECKRLSVAFVSRIRLSNCFSISCVFDSILWEKSWRERKSWKNICKKNSRKHT